MALIPYRDYLRRLVMALSLLAALGAPLSAAAEGVWTEPNPEAPAETAQFAFLIGERWCTARNMQPDGTYVDAGSAQWNGRFVLDGWAIEDEWIKELPDGRVVRGINIRSFNPESGRWDNRWLANTDLQWKYFWAEQVGDTMVMTGGEGEDANGAFVDRNIFSEIHDGGFRWRKDRSWDGGESWIEGVGRIECRAPSSNGSAAP